MYFHEQSFIALDFKVDSEYMYFVWIRIFMFLPDIEYFFASKIPWIQVKPWTFIDEILQFDVVFRISGNFDCVNFHVWLWDLYDRVPESETPLRKKRED